MINQVENVAEKKDTQLNEQQVVDYLNNHSEFFLRHASLLSELEIPHESGGVVSLVERQVSVLREKNQYFEEKLQDMVDAVHENQRLHISLLRLAINLFDADSLDDILGVVDDELRHKLGADFVYFRLHNETLLVNDTQGHTYVTKSDKVLQMFSVLINKTRIQCGDFTGEQINALFMRDAPDVMSAAIVPISVPGIYGVIALGSCDERRYHAGMGTEFLNSLSELIGSAMRAQVLR